MSKRNRLITEVLIVISGSSNFDGWNKYLLSKEYEALLKIFVESQRDD